jgi:tetratricopeptide (TPR) repeat protein
MKMFPGAGKIWTLIFSGLIALSILAIHCKRSSDSTSKYKLPEPPASVKMTGPVENQIQAAKREVVKNPTSGNFGQLGTIYHSNAFYKEAKECYLLAINADPDEWIWNYYLGYLCSEMGETEQAVSYFTKAARLNPKSIYVGYYLGETYVKLGNTLQAEEIFNHLIVSADRDSIQQEEIRNNLYPLKVYVQLSLARIYMNTSRLDPAIKILQSVIKDYQDYGPAYRLLSNIYSQQGKDKLSIENSQRANELSQFISPVDPLIAQLAILSRSDEYILKQIDIAAFSGNQEWAKKLLDHALIFMPDNPFLISKSIQFYLLYGFGDDINQKIDKHYSAFSNDFNELAKLATLFNKNGKYGWAIMYYERCKQLKPDDFTILHNLAINYSNAGDVKNTEILIDKLLTIKPEDTEFIADAAFIYIRLGENDKAMLLIERIKKLTPENPVINKLMAEVSLNEGNHQLAYHYYSKFFNKVPNDPEAIQYLGSRYMENKSWDNAIRHFKKALGYFPNNPLYIEKLGSLYYNCPDTRLRDLNQARYYLERAYLSIKSSAEIRISSGKNLAAVYASEKKWDQAISVITTTRIMAIRGKYPDQEIQLLTKTMEEYKTKSVKKI